MKSGERKAKRNGIYDTMEHEPDSRAAERFRRPATAYGKCQTMLELRHIMQAADKIEDEDRRVIHRLAAKYQ